jgi:hypothetical protein
MSDDDKDETSPPGILSRIFEGGLPQVIAGPAGKAISRLIAGAADIPAAWLEKHAQKIKDETGARSEVIKAMAAAASAHAAASPEIVDRALGRWIGVQAQRQHNREEIAKRAVEHLREDPASAESEGPSDDWMNVYEDFAEKVSSEVMQDLWSRMLAGEIRKRGAFSLATLAFVSTLDGDAVEHINRVLPWILNHHFVPKALADLEIIPMGLLIHTESLGFGMLGAGLLSARVTPNDKSEAFFRAGDRAFVLTMSSPKLVSVPALLLTVPGKELSRIIPRAYEIDRLAAALWEQRPEKMEIGRARDSENDHYFVTDKVLVTNPKSSSGAS